MVNTKNIKHIFFDLDDTLWDFEKNSSAVLQNLFIEFDLQTKLNTSFNLFFYHYKLINTSLWQQYYKKQITKEYLRNNRFNEAFKYFKYDNYDLNLLVTEAYLSRSPHGKILKENCIEVLDFLKPNYNLHIITNGFKEVQNIKIDACNIGHYFTSIIISEEHNLTKPDKQLFTLAQTINNTISTECIMIGDNYDADVLGAKNAGWQSIWLNESVTSNEPNQIKNLKQLIQFFKPNN